MAFKRRQKLSVAGQEIAFLAFLSGGIERERERKSGKEWEAE